ncbi:MAG: histidinol-phosphate aminotransferase family protein, partial [Spirochaetales bacterium]|nr:histidinol-phosphate aminotransferase family protein [Spirochaetales bacterium]
ADRSTARGGSIVSECVKLDLNEMPYCPPENVVKAAQRGLSSLNRYADPQSLERLALLLGEYAGVDSERIVIGPGSDLLLREIVLCFGSRRKVVMVSPTFPPTVQVARSFARKLVSLRLDRPAFTLAPEPLLQELSEPSLVIIDNPNNPTGKLILDRDLVEEILDIPDTLLVVDEAYFEFSGLTFADKINDHDNLALGRTMDKAFGLAGARIGYLIAGRRFLSAFSSAFSFLPQSSMEAAIEALRHQDYMWKNVQLIVHERERLSRELEMQRATVVPSSTNFLLLRSTIPSPADELRERFVLVMDVSNQLGPRFIRVNLGTPEENDAFLRTYRSIRNEHDEQELFHEHRFG